jgi:hypothetical protein
MLRMRNYDCARDDLPFARYCEPRKYSKPHDRAPLHRGQYLLVARMQGFAVYSAIDVFHLDRSSSTKLRSPTVEANCCTSAW